MAQTKNIIFDLGGVLLNLDYTKTLQAFKDLGYLNFEEMYNQYQADALFENLEIGHISEDEFYKLMMDHRKENISREAIAAAWNKMLLSFRLESLAFLQQLSKHYKLYLLSNTNAIHLQAFNEIFHRETDFPSLDSFFTKAYYSHKINLRKPGKEIFEFVLQDADIKAEETLFIDDSFNNIDTARNLGFKVHLLQPGEKVEELEELKMSNVKRETSN